MLKAEWGVFIWKSYSARFSIYFDKLFRKKTNISIRMCKEKEMRIKLADNQVFMPFVKLVGCRKSPRSYDCQHVCDIGKFDFIF